VEKNPILIVDDETSYLELMKDFLNQEGYANIITESNPLNVIPLLDRTDIDLILLDIFMPEMNGLEVMRSINQIEPTTTVILISGAGEKEHVVEAMRLGAIDFLEKPFDLDQFGNVVIKAINLANRG